MVGAFIGYTHYSCDTNIRLINCYSIANGYALIGNNYTPLSMECCYNAGGVLYNSRASDVLIKVEYSYDTVNLSSDTLFKGEDVFTNTSKMPLLNKYYGYEATSDYPINKLNYSWFRIGDGVSKNYIQTQIKQPKPELVLTDNSTGINYKLFIRDGALQLEVVE